MPSKDTWNIDYDQIVELGARIGIKIRERDSNNTDPKLNTRLRKLILDYQMKLQSLKTLLQKQRKDYSIPDDEITRREQMIGELSTKYEQLRASIDRGWTPETRYKSTSNETWGQGDDEIRLQQDQMIAEQDEGLGELSKALKNQQRMGLTMQDEIQEHNVLIDDIHDHASKTDDRIQFQTRRAEEVRRKDSCRCTCALWTTIVFLAIGIVLVAAVPF